jgi:hypothetical protein
MKCGIRIDPQNHRLQIGRYEGDATPEDFEVRVTYSENEDSGCF